MRINPNFVSVGCGPGAHQQDERAFAAPTWPLELFHAVNATSFSYSAISAL
jgi:hypothetical protein